MPPVDSLTRAASTYSEVGIITHVHRNLTQQAPTTWDQTSTYSSRALQGVSRDAGGRLGPASHVNELFRRGSPSNNLGQVGLIIHQFDELEVFGREWEMCTGGGCTCQGRHLHGRISASIVWQGLRERKDRVNIPLAFGDRAGILMNGNVLEITCGFGIDGSSYQDNSRFNPGCHSFCDASTILDPYGNLKDEAHGDWACGWVVLALGKLGAGELNYSSDIDLILLHDPIDNPLTDRETSQATYVGMTRDLVRLLSTSTGDGIGWRVDLRLRPDPGATAVSIQREAALGYYESIARTWERAAFIRARPVAGDIAMGEQFLADIQPFVWRRTLDYTVMDDMKVMLRRPTGATGWEGFNLKTGPNGIRSIEFLTHVLQLVGGGRVETLRDGSTLPALAALATEQWISEAQRDRLSKL